MRPRDLLRKVLALSDRATSYPEPYEVWWSRFPPGEFREDGTPMEHPAVVMAELDDSEFRVLVITTKKDGVPFVHELTPEQAAAAGVDHGVFRYTNPHEIDFEDFIHQAKTASGEGGAMLRAEALDIEARLVRHLQRTPRRGGPRY